MKNESKFVQNVKSKLTNKEFNEDFMVSHFFTQYKLKSADFFVTQLEQIEKSETAGIVGNRRNEARIYIDCFCYELDSTYDGIFNEINSSFKLGYKHGWAFRQKIQNYLRNQNSSAMKMIDAQWENWIKNFKVERNDYTHIKIRGQHIHYELGKSIEVYDRYDMLDPNKKTLVKKLRDYYNKMYNLIDDVYEELNKEL